MIIKKVDSINGHQGALKFSDLSAGDSFTWVINPDILCIKVKGAHDSLDGYVKLGTGTHWTIKYSNNGHITKNSEVKKVVSEVHYI